MPRRQLLKTGFAPPDHGDPGIISIYTPMPVSTDLPVTMGHKVRWLCAPPRALVERVGPSL
jgi:hypothetical protein